MACMALAPLGAQYTSIAAPGSELGADSLTIQWPRTVWFGKHKIRIGAYASCVLKTGISSSSNKVQVGDHVELMTKEPFKAELEDSLSRKFTVKGTWARTSGAWMQSNGVLSDILNLGIEEETYSADPSDLEILSAEIHDSENPDQVWELKVKRTQSSGVIWEELDAYLSNGVRVILIEGPAGIEGADVEDPRTDTTYYAFVEKGVVLARVNRRVSTIAFSRETPGITRLLLLAAAINL